MRTSSDTLQTLYKELAYVQTLTEAEAQKYMNADDSKEEILKTIQEDIDFYERDEEEESFECGSKLDPAFSSWGDVNGMFFTV